MGGTIWSTQHDMVRMSFFAPDPRGHYRQKSRVEFRRGPILVSASASITIRPLSDIREDTIVVHLRDRHTFLSDKAEPGRVRGEFNHLSCQLRAGSAAVWLSMVSLQL